MTPLQVLAFTLVDVTNSQIYRVSESNTKEYHQQQNLNVLLQTISLRSQPIDPVVSIGYGVDLDYLKFGNFYINEQATVWTVKFYIEHEAVWSDGNDEFAYLKSDAHGIAITPDLDNTVEFPVNIFDTQDNVNLFFKMG